MSPDTTDSTNTTDVDWVREHLSDGTPLGDTATERARLALMVHVAAAGAPEAARDARPRRRVRGSHRRPLTLGLAAGAAALAAFAVVNVTSPGHGGTVAEANAAQIVGHARHALDAGSGQTLSVTFTDLDGSTTQTAEDDATPQDWTVRPASASGQPGLAEGQEDGMREFYDPSTNTIYRDSDTSTTVVLADGDEALLDELNAPGAKTVVDRGATLDGRTVTELTSTESDGTVYGLWVDPANGDRPLQFTQTLPSAPTQTATWRGYATSTPNASAPSPARLTDLYPTATVTTLDAAAYSAAQSRAGSGS